MSFNFSPNIVTDGLKLCLDAANGRSYIDSSSPWYDISRTGANGTIINSPSYTSENKGGLVLNGSSQYVSLGTNQTYYFNLTNPYSISVWFKANVLATMGLVTRYNAGVRGNYFLKFLSNGAIMFNREVSPFNLFSNSILSTGVAYNVTIVYDGSYQKIYVNGIFDNQGLSGNISQDQSNVSLYIGCSQSSSSPTEFFNGTIYCTKIYNKALSQSEITQNHNALKSRFGL